jgi:hypothetical protein
MSLSLYWTLLTLYAEPSTTKFHCPSNNADMLDTNDPVVSAVVVQEVVLKLKNELHYIYELLQPLYT